MLYNHAMVFPRPLDYPLPEEENKRLYQIMADIRFFEETVLDNFSKGVFYGTTHTYIGQEANAAGVLSQIQPGDIVVSNHRCHGHFLAYGGDMRALFAELMGKSTGVCGGRGGSQHIHWQNFYSNGVLGGTAPIAAGMALAEKQKGSGAVALVFLGDGALGEGAVYETLNLASLWQAPVVFVIENNRIAQTTPIEISLAGSIRARFEAFGIKTIELDTSHVAEIAQAARQTLAATRNQQKPHALILHTHRFGPHSKGDDTRPPEDIQAMRTTKDPLTLFAKMLPQGVAAEIEMLARKEVAAAFSQALADPLASEVQ